MNRVIGVNGIYSDGSGNTDLLLGDLRRRGFATRDFNYPRVNLFTARWRWLQRDNGRQLYWSTRHLDNVIAHSYGCLVVLRAMEVGARFDQVFLFGPAMDRDVSFPPNGARRIHCIHNRRDRAVGLGALLLCHSFGAMGRYGYSGEDPRVINIPAAETHHIREPLHHSDYFIDANRKLWADYICDHLGPANA